MLWPLTPRARRPSLLACDRASSNLELGIDIDGFDIRLFGLAKRSLMVVAAAMAVNLRLVDRWDATGGADPGPAVIGDRVIWHFANGDPPDRRRTTDPPQAA